MEERTGMQRLKQVLEESVFEGVPFIVCADQTLNPGDTYLAARNTGPHLLTVRDVHRDASLVGGWVNPVELAYPFDIPECVKIDLLIEEG